MTRRIHVIGIGAGDPDYVTAQAIEALNDTQVIFAMDKGDTKDDLVALRRQICERFIREPGYRFVALADPPRAKDGDYRQAVADWHAARARIWADAIESELGPEGVGAFLAWGDPSLYDSTLRILDTVASARRHRVRRHPRHHRDPGADRAASHPAQRRRRTGAHHHRQAAARQRVVGQRRGDARRGVLVPELSARYPHLVGRLPRHARRTAVLRHGRRRWAADRTGSCRSEGAHGWIMDTYLLRSAD